MKNFSVEEPAKFSGPFFGGRDKILLMGNVLKFLVIFQKFALELLRKF